MPASDHDVLHAADLVGVYGLGREGRAIVRHLRRERVDAAMVVLLDTTPDAATQDAAADLDVPIVAGEDDVVNWVRTARPDVVVRSPGVPLRGAGLTAAREQGVRVTSGTNLWFESEAPDNVIAVTGTKGKSTTSALLAHLLREAGRDVALLGNIGAALLDHDRSPATHDHVVVELSSYQLADLHEPLATGVWLNLHREHVDWHGSHAAYAADKGRIVGLARTLVANAADAEVAGVARGHADVRWVDASGDPVALGSERLPRAQLEDALAGSPLVGGHHVANLAAALTAAAAVGADATRLLDHVRTFRPLPHRLELVLDDGRRWVDDSISTIPEASVAALRAFPDATVTLLAGGHDRGQDHAPLVEEVLGRDAVRVVTLPDTGARLAADLRRAGADDRVLEADDLAHAVTLASRVTPAGGVVLLSPAAPSYGYFSSFEDRGARFREHASAIERSTDA